MMPIAGKPMLGHVIDRCELLNVAETVVALPDCPRDDEISQYVKSRGLRRYRGSEKDVLSRYVRAAHEFKAEAIVRITADCPLLDPYTSNKVIKTFMEDGYEYVSNIYPKRTFPKGWDTEVFTYGALLLADQHCYREDREHVTPWMQKNLITANLRRADNDSGKFSLLNFSVDTQEDLDRVKRILE